MLLTVLMQGLLFPASARLRAEESAARFTASTVINQMMQNPSQRLNILSATYASIGIGLYQKSDGTICAALFFSEQR